MNKDSSNQRKHAGSRKSSAERSRRDGPSSGPLPESAASDAAGPDAVEAPAPESAPATACPVVGIGASAGGIEAMIRLFEALPSDTGAAFLVVMHLDPTRDSGLAHLLGRHNAMPFAEAADGMAIEPDHVYVIAPDCALTVDGERLRLTEPAERRGHRYPIDRLFVSLAQNRRETRDLHRPVGHRKRRHGRTEGGEGAGRLHPGQDPATASVRRHAAQRDPANCPGAGGSPAPERECA